MARLRSGSKMLSDVCVIPLILSVSAILEAGPQQISSLDVSRNYSHPSHPVPEDQVQLLLSPLPAGFLLLPQLPHSISFGDA